MLNFKLCINDWMDRLEEALLYSFTLLYFGDVRVCKGYEECGRSFVEQ